MENDQEVNKSQLEICQELIVELKEETNLQNNLKINIASLFYGSILALSTSFGVYFIAAYLEAKDLLSPKAYLIIGGICFIIMGFMLVQLFKGRKEVEKKILDHKEVAMRLKKEVDRGLHLQRRSNALNKT